MAATGAKLWNGLALAAAAALGLAGATAADAAGLGAAIRAAAAAPAAATQSSTVNGADDDADVDAMTTVGDETTSLPGPASSLPDPADGAGSQLSASPTGEDRPLDVIVAGKAGATGSFDQSSNVSAHPGLNGGVSDAH